jgi:hypothetical protein
VKFIISDGGLDEISGDIMPEDPITDPVGSSPSMGEQA